MRTANPDPKARHKLLKAATKLMLTRGFSATSLDDVCVAADLTKGSLFHYFSSKEELGAAVLDRYLENVFAKLDEVRAAQREPLARVTACLEFLAASAHSWPLSEGCILGKFTQELAETRPRIRARCAGHFERWIETVASDLDEAAKLRKLRQLDTRSLAEYVIAAFEGALILGRAQGDCRVVGRTLDHARRYLESCFDRRR